MSETKKREKKQATPRQVEIKRLIAKGRDKRSDQESARLDQLKMEERRERFLHIAPRRVQKALKALRQVANCANASNYSYTTEEAAKIGQFLENAVANCCEAFSPKTRDEQQFSL